MIKMALPKLDRKNIQQRSFNIINMDSKNSQNFGHSLSTENMNVMTSQVDDYNFPVINANGAEMDANLSALNYTRNHSYRKSSIKMSDSTRSSRVRKRSSVDIASTSDKNMPSLALSSKGKCS